MHFTSRAAIAILSGVGSGLIGFWLVWRFVERAFGVYPGLDHDAWLLAGIFAPFVVVTLIVFRALSKAGVTPPSAPPACGSRC